MDLQVASGQHQLARAVSMDFDGRRKHTQLFEQQSEVNSARKTALKHPSDQSYAAFDKCWCSAA